MQTKKYIKTSLEKVDRKQKTGDIKTQIPELQKIKLHKPGVRAKNKWILESTYFMPNFSVLVRQLTIWHPRS